MPAPHITTLSVLQRQLHRAMQLEHATIPPYLTALYSIKPGTNPDAVQVLRVVVVEEMLHLVLAANLLNAVGGTPRVTETCFVPRYPAHLPDGERDFEVHLQPFSHSAIETFLKIERPALAPEGAERVKPLPDGRASGATYLGLCADEDAYRYWSIGEFYRAIEDGIVTLEEEAQAKGDTIFVGEPKHQVTGEYYYSGGGEAIPVVDLGSARAAIAAIIEQGEGEVRRIYGPGGELAHYYRFQQLRDGRFFQTSDDKGDLDPVPTGPALKVDWDAVYPLKADAKMADYAPGSEAAAAAEAFNAAYGDFLALLQRAFTGEPALLLEGVPMMFKLRERMNQLIRNPLGAGSPFNAAPTFEVDCPPEACP